MPEQEQPTIEEIVVDMKCMRDEIVSSKKGLYDWFNVYANLPVKPGKLTEREILDDMYDRYTKCYEICRSRERR